MKNIMKYICLFLMVIGISIEVKGEIYTDSPMSMNINLDTDDGYGIFDFIVKNSGTGWSLANSGHAWIEAEVINHTDVVDMWTVNSNECTEYSCGTSWSDHYGQLPIELLYDFSSAGVYNVTVRVTEYDYRYGTAQQTHDFTVTFNVTGGEQEGYDVTYHVPSCVTSPVNNTTVKSETFAAPAPAVPGYKFEGWVTNPVEGQSQRPSTVYAAGADVPAACNAYALYSNVSAVFTRTNTLTSGKNYLIVGSYTPGGTAKAMSNVETTNNRFSTVEWETSSDNKITCRDWSCIWRFDNPSGNEWTIYNEEVGKYAGATGDGATSGTDRAAKLVNNGSADAARWTYSVNSYTFTITNKARSSCTDKVLKLSSGYAGFYSTGSNPFLFVQEELTPNYTTNPVCDANTYTVTYSANGASGSVPTDIAQYQAGDMVTVKGKGDLEKACHTFVGWKCNKDDVTYTAGQTVAIGSSNMTFTAQWSEITSSLTVEEVGIGMSAGSITEGNSDDVTCGTELTLAYTTLGTNMFCGWQVVNGSGTDVTESVVNGNTLTMPGYPITVSAHIFADVRWKCAADIELTGDVHLTSANGIEVFTTNFAEEPNKNIVVSMSSRGDAAKLRVRFLDSDDNEVAPADCPFALYYYGWTGSGTHNNYTQTYSGTNNYHYIDISTCPDAFKQTFAIGYSPKSAGVYDTYKIKIEACNSGNTALGNPAILTLYGRSLPAQFVIAMKSTNGDSWYALPNDLATGTSEGSSTKAPIMISVDNTTAPTSATLAPKNTLYKGDGRYATDHRNAIRFLRADATDNAWITTSSTSQLYMPNNGANAQDFNLRSSDLAKYTIKQDGKTGAIAMFGGTIGWYSNSNNTVYLLPVDASAEPAVFDVVEWFPTKLLIESSQAITTTSVQVGADEASEAEASTTTYGTNLYEVQTGDLTAKGNQQMTVSYEINEVLYTKMLTTPIILTGSAYTTSSGSLAGVSGTQFANSEVVVRDGATLTLDATTVTHNKFHDASIYPTSKVVVPTDKKFDVVNLTMRGGYDEIYEDGNYTMGYDEPQLYLAGTCTATKINYEKRVNLDQMHGMSVPFEVEQMAITYLNGAVVKEGGNLYIDAYNGESRAQKANTSEAWYYYDAQTTPLYRGVGYTISAEPMVEGQNYTILRAPMTTGWTSAGGNESTAELEVNAWGAGTSIPDNHKGWNCLGNPYLANFGKADDATFGGNLYIGQLVKTLDEKGNWTGGWYRNDETVRYVTIPHDDGHGFDQVRVQDAVLKPFRHFFVQVKTTGTLTFDKGNIQNSVVARAMNDEPKEIELGILMSNGQVTDNCGLLIGEDFSEGYDMMSDLGKELGQSMAIYTITGDYKLAFNAMNEDYAKGYIPVGYLAPKAGEYTISFDNDRYDIAPCVEHIYLLENGVPVADLKSVDYNFETTAGTNDDRFALNIVFNHNIGTDLSGVDSMDEMPVKIVHNDKMYILMRGKVYSTTGKFIKAIKK